MGWLDARSHRWGQRSAGPSSAYVAPAVRDPRSKVSVTYAYLVASTTWPDLFTVELDGGPHMRWRHHRLGGLVTPLGLAREKSLEAAARVPHDPFVNPFTEVIAALDKLGLDSAVPPKECTAEPVAATLRIWTSCPPTKSPAPCAPGTSRRH
jgi:hypothetical protein